MSEKATVLTVLILTCFLIGCRDRFKPSKVWNIPLWSICEKYQIEDGWSVQIYTTNKPTVVWVEGNGSWPAGWVVKIR